MLLEECVREIITKEDERYRLVSVSLLLSKSEVIKHISNRKDLQQIKEKSSFFELRNKILEILYSEYITVEEINAFISDESIFKDWVTRVSADILKRLRLRSKPNTTIDADLNPSPHTLAFIASNLVISGLVDYSKYKVYKALENVESDLSRIYTKHYPISIYQLIDLLKKNDTDLWKVFQTVIYKITCILSYKYVYDKYNKDDAKNDVWIQCSDKMYNLILSGDIPAFDTAIHLRNFIWRVSYNIIRNRSRSHHLTPLYLDDMTDSDINEALLFDLPKLEDFSFFDIDIDDTRSLKLGLVQVLFHKPQGIYEFIAKGIDDKIDILLQYADGKSYKDLAKSIYGDELPCEKQVQCEDNLRKIVSRVRKTLMDRFKDLTSKRLRNGKP